MKAEKTLVVFCSGRVVKFAVGWAGQVWKRRPAACLVCSGVTRCEVMSLVRNYNSRRVVFVRDVLRLLQLSV